MFRICSALWCLALGSLIVAGCQSSQLPPNARPTKPVTVTVMYKGAPVEGAGVTFTAEINPIAAYGMTDKSGKAPLKTYIEGDGAVIGKHKVSVSKMEVTGGGEASIDSPDYDPTSAGGPPPVPKSLIPMKYASSDTSGLTAEVTESGPNEITLELAD
jgi:hypothetical protein